MAGFGSLAKPYVENPFAGRITKVHWRRRGDITCGGTATATGVGPWPFNGTVGYSGTGDLAVEGGPSQVFVGGCREGQDWTLSVECVLSMTLGPLQPDSHNPTLPDLSNTTQNATYSAEFQLWTVEGRSLGALLSSASLGGALHNEELTAPFGAGTVETDEARTSISVSGTGYTVFAFLWEFTADPDPITEQRASNVGGGAGFGALAVADFP